PSLCTSRVGVLDFDGTREASQQKWVRSGVVELPEVKPGVWQCGSVGNRILSANEPATGSITAVGVEAAKRKRPTGDPTWRALKRTWRDRANAVGNFDGDRLDIRRGGDIQVSGLDKQKNVV